MKAYYSLLLTGMLSCFGFQSLAADSNDALDNAAVIELQKLGLGDAVIIDKIKASRGHFDVGLDGLKQLKTAGVSDEVIRTMIGATSSGQITGGQSGTADANDPKSPHDAGIWLFEEKEGKGKMTLLEPSVYSQTKHGVAIFAQYGQTAKSEAILRSAHASLQTANHRPVFYFYFEVSKTSLSSANSAITSPNEFVLAEFKKDEKNNLRKLVVGQFNAYTGGQVGPEDKSVRSFDFEKIAAGIYKVQPKTDLAGGEYGFFYAGPTAGYGGKILDFGFVGSADTDPKKASGKEPKPAKTAK